MKSQSRKRPTLDMKAKAIIEQKARCGYCNISLVDEVVIWDHFLPHAYTMTNHANNWVATCPPCNKAKSDMLFRTEADLRHFCLKMLKSHGSFAEGWPDGASMAFKDYLSR